MPEAATKGKTKTKGDNARSEPTLPALRVRYYRRMRPQRVYAVEVNWQKSKQPPPGDDKKVTVRLIVAGAQVLPSEQTMDPAKPAATATFFVTPLAKGWLRNQKLEVLLQGRKVQEIPLKTKVVTEGLTWSLLLLMFVVPWFLLAYVKYTPLNETVVPIKGKGPVHKLYEKNNDITGAVEKFIEDNVPPVPHLVKEEIPVVDSTLKEARTYLAEKYGGLVKLSQTEPLAFYAGGALFLLVLLSAWCHRVKRKKAVGKPIPLGGGAEEDED